MDALHEAIIDNETEHIRIIALLDMVIAGIHTGTINKHAVSGLANELLAHFASESERMVSTNYPLSSAHTRDHHRLSVILNLLIQHNITEINTKNCVYQIRDLFIDHIREYDRAFDVYLMAYLGMPEYNRRSLPRSTM